MLCTLQSQPPNDMVKKELDMNCFSSSSARSVVLAGPIAMMFIPNFMKTRELSDSFPRALHHSIGLLEENTNLQRETLLPSPHHI